MRDLPNPTFAFSPVSMPRGSLHRPENEQLQTLPSAAKVERAGLLVSWARHADEVRQAQRLRYRVFADEMGARLTTPVAGHDIDLFDNYCEHLLVRDEVTQEVVGTYRVLTPAQAKRVGSTYSDTEFDLTRLRGLRERMVELGRSCVHPDHRHAASSVATWRPVSGSSSKPRNWPQLNYMCGHACLCHWNISTVSWTLSHRP
ncbi:MAG: hypothetical protein FD135_3770 [Comamonadaceae bacterium]|nr:MAG: hypothetical protein FD135_3770 [Comamonadaceae bacterium]